MTYYRLLYTLSEFESIPPTVNIRIFVYLYPHGAISGGYATADGDSGVPKAKLEATALRTANRHLTEEQENSTGPGSAKNC